MKSNLIVFSLLSLVSCGNPTGTRTTPPYEPTRLTNQWVSLRDGHEMDLRDVRVNEIQDSRDVIECNGTFGKSGSVNGIERGLVAFSGSNFEGTAQFGNLAYVNADDGSCRELSKERYEYSVLGNVLKMRNIAYCLKHFCPQDGIEFYKLKE
jgi:hypothetical protein